MPVSRSKHCSLFFIISISLVLMFLFLLFSEPSPVSLRSRHLIQDGMTEEQVVSILAAAPGDYRTRTALYGGLQQIAIPSSAFDSAKTGTFREPTVKKWTTNDGEISVTFDEDGKVIGKAFNEPKVSVGWLEEKWDSVLVNLGLRKPRMWCIN
jgi:hypothetical protein